MSSLCCAKDKKEFDLFIIGGGSAGFAAAIKASEMGANVGIAEYDVIGGTCLNRGCIPSKNLLAASELYYYSSKDRFPGITIPDGRLDFAMLIQQKDDLIAKLRKVKYIDIVDSNPKITYFPFKSRFISKNEVKVGEELIYSNRFIITTGARPAPLSVDGIERVECITSKEALELKRLPESMIIVGGRFVGLEMAQLYAHLGTKVTILQRSPYIIPDEEIEISIAMKSYLEDEGIEIYTGVKITGISQDGNEKRAAAIIDGKERQFSGDELLFATGSKPNTHDLNLEGAGVDVREDGAVIVDDEMRTTAPHIFAAGDVVGKTMLVTTAAHEGAIAGENSLNDCCYKKVDYTSIPHAIFTQPNLASCGLTERQARGMGLPIKTRILEMKFVPRANAIRDTRGLIKMIANTENDEVLGIHILSRDAAEIIHQAVLILKNRMTLSQVAKKIDVYPTMSEMIKLTAQSFFKDVNKLSCCAE